MAKFEKKYQFKFYFSGMTLICDYFWHSIENCSKALKYCHSIVVIVIVQARIKHGHTNDVAVGWNSNVFASRKNCPLEVSASLFSHLCTNLTHVLWCIVADWGFLSSDKCICMGGWFRGEYISALYFFMFEYITFLLTSCLKAFKGASPLSHFCQHLSDVDLYLKYLRGPCQNITS